MSSLVCRFTPIILYAFVTYHRIANKSYATCVTKRAITAYSTGTSEFTHMSVGFEMLNLLFRYNVL